MQKYIDGEDIPDWVKVEDRFFDESNAAEFQGKQFFTSWPQRRDGEGSRPGAGRLRSAPVG